MAKTPNKSRKNGGSAAANGNGNGNAPAAGPFATKSYPTTIEEIVAAGANGTFARQEVYDTLVQLGLAEVNTSVHDGNGAIAIRATPKGYEYVAKQRQDASLSAAVEVESDDVEMPAFSLEDGIEIPELGPRVGFGRKSVYPFETMSVGQSFLVRGVSKDDKRFKGLASTVSAAQRRFAREIPGVTRTNRAGEVVPATEPTRRFVLRAVEGGARVWRTA